MHFFVGDVMLYVFFIYSFIFFLLALYWNTILLNDMETLLKIITSRLQCFFVGDIKLYFLFYLFVYFFF